MVSKVRETSRARLAMVKDKTRSVTGAASLCVALKEQEEGGELSDADCATSWIDLEVMLLKKRNDK